MLVGAGMHAASFLYTLRRVHPSLSVLVVERSPTICSTLAKLGDSLVLNSPTFSSVGLNSNIMPGHFIQLSDFDELVERPFPTAKHLYELATMTLFHADADIAFEFEVEDVTPRDGGYQVSGKDHAVWGRSVVVANGLSDPATGTYASEHPSERIVHGDDFIAARFAGDTLEDRVRDRRVAVVGAGDTANCVIEQLLPMVYPHQHYGFAEEAPFLPRSVAWIGQQATGVKEFFFQNKQRYCHSGGVIEFFWDGDTPFDLTEDVWRHARSRIECVAHKLTRVTPCGDALALSAGSRCLEIDLLIDCSGRSNPLSARLRQHESEFVQGDIVFHGGQWDEALEHFVSRPRKLQERRLACRLKGERVFFVGSACPLNELVDDAEARNGSFRYQEQRASLTNSKWSLEHTLPRTVALAQRFDEYTAH
ncbi:MAG: SidA/IucD/PvdA family monooxygenase [Pseudomonadota bacterium]